MQHNRVNLEKNDTKEWIFQALLILLREKNLEVITITEICEKAGVNRSSFYRNFASKEDVIAKQLDYDFKKIVKLLNDNHSATYIYSYIFLNCKYVIELANYNLDYIMFEFLNQLQQRILKTKYIADEKDKLISVYHIAGVLNILLHWLNSKKAISTKELTQIIKDQTGEVSKHYLIKVLSLIVDK